MLYLLIFDPNWPEGCFWGLDKFHPTRMRQHGLHTYYQVKMKWHSFWHRRSQAMPWGTWAILSSIEFVPAQPDCNILREDKQICLIKYMYMHIIRAKHLSIGSFLWSITQKWDSTDLIWDHVASAHLPSLCRLTERSRHQPLVPPYSCSPLWTLWKVSGVELTSTTKYA